MVKVNTLLIKLNYTTSIFILSYKIYFYYKFNKEQKFIQ